MTQRLRRVAADVLEALGGPRERIRSADAARSNWSDVDPLNTVGIEVPAEPDARVLARARAADALFEHDGQITKREIRALTLSSLAPRPGELLWDIGAGSGSVAIEWMLADPRTAPSRSSRMPIVRRASAAMPRHSACRDLRSSKKKRRPHSLA